jgi:hypothetical protein
MTGGDPRLAASWLVTAGFVFLPLVLAAAFVAGVAVARDAREPRVAAWRRAGLAFAGAAAWLGLTWALAASGVLRRFDATPPPFAPFVVAITVLGVAIAFSPVGTRLVRGWSLAALVSVQAFRLPLELVMHRAYEDGVMPVQMSYSGWNFDVVTGISAAILGVALSRWRVPRWVVGLWNVVGLLLLLNVVTIAVLSTPLFRVFGDDRLNTFVAWPPFVWLPAVLVVAAWAGHLLVFRKLRLVDQPRTTRRRLE